MGRRWGVDDSEASSGLTLAKMLKVRALLQEADAAGRRRFEEEGGWVFCHVRWPRSKKRRIRRKWMRDGRVLGLRWIPPVKPETKQ